MQAELFEHAKRAVVNVGDGRGFVVRGKDEDDRLIITAAHCLPSFPPCAMFSFTEERTYASLVGQIGAEATVWAECLFADPIGDIAILGPPDNQSLFEQWDEYNSMLDDVPPLSISDAPSNGTAWLLSLDCRWTRCEIERFGDGPLWIAQAEDIAGGMSGSPILAADGAAIGVVCTGSHSGKDAVCTEGGPNPVLTRNLPGWFLR